MQTINLDQIKLQKKLKKLLAFLPVLVILAILAVSSVYKVNTGEAAVITRFGSAVRVVEDAGIHMKLPVIEAARKVSLAKRHQIEYGYCTLKPAAWKHPLCEVPEEQIDRKPSATTALVLTEPIVEYRVNNPIQYSG